MSVRKILVASPYKCSSVRLFRHPATIHWVKSDLPELVSLEHTTLCELSLIHIMTCIDVNSNNGIGMCVVVSSVLFRARDFREYGVTVRDRISQ